MKNNFGWSEIGEMLIRQLLSMKQLIFPVVLVLAVTGATWLNHTRMSQAQNSSHRQLMEDNESDRISLPPLQAEFLSQQRNFRFIISTKDNWKLKQGLGKLIRCTNGVSEVIWEGQLPQEYGPRHVLVGKQGEVLMLDEWINVKSKYAVFVLNPQNDKVIQHNFDSIQKILGVPTSAIVESAVGGSWWISKQPFLDESGSTAYVPTAGKILKVDLQTGELSL